MSKVRFGHQCGALVYLPALTFSWIIFQVYSSVAFAQQSDLCPDLLAIRGKIRTCSFNLLFVKAASLCEARLDAETAKHSSILGDSILSKSQKADSGQFAEAKVQVGNLEESQGSLEQIRREATKVRAQFKEYLESFQHPAGVSKELASRLPPDFLSYLDQLPCCSVNKGTLTKYINRMDQKIAKLDATIAQVAGLQKQTGSVAKSVGSASPARVQGARATHAIGEASSARRGPAKASSITGTQESKQKEALTEEASEEAALRRVASSPFVSLS